MAYIICRDGEEVLIDDSWYEELSNFKWYIQQGYASSTFENRVTKMHVFILGSKKGWHTHHKNGNKLDNRESNLVQIPDHLHSALHNRLRPTESKWAGFRF